MDDKEKALKIAEEINTVEGLKNLSVDTARLMEYMLLFRRQFLDLKDDLEEMTKSRDIWEAEWTEDRRDFNKFEHWMLAKLKEDQTKTESLETELTFLQDQLAFRDSRNQLPPDGVAVLKYLPHLLDQTMYIGVHSDKVYHQLTDYYLWLPIPYPKNKSCKQ